MCRDASLICLRFLDLRRLVSFSFSSRCNGATTLVKNEFRFLLVIAPGNVFQPRVAPSPIGSSKFGSLRRLTQQFEFFFCSCVDDYLPSLTRPPLCIMSAVRMFVLSFSHSPYDSDIFFRQVTEGVSVAALPERSDDSARLTPFQEMITLFQGLDIFDEGGAHSKQLLDRRRFVLFPLRATKVRRLCRCTWRALSTVSRFGTGTKKLSTVSGRPNQS